MDTPEEQGKRLLTSDEAPQPVDGCGCAQSPISVHRGVTRNEGIPAEEQGVPPMAEAPTATPAVPTTTESRRGIKLVITLQPEAGIGYRAVLAVGMEGCDPLLRSVEVTDLSAALDQVPGLFADAAARWQVQPRYPSTLPATASPEQRRGKGKSASPVPVPDPNPTPDTPTTPPAPKPGGRAASSDQLSLFG
ncbi:MAG: hypothetical protein HY689_01830 [Chloroflexi bacterium]|nr:hypothetical protein [Chloroflexota bacterium]